ncbi:MAG: hypothetical protein E7484_00105 [Ruminococcaceae bacterium]|nr:hypothetical protein [Oscillospiraceae bacterium]
MKKLISFIISMAMCLSFTACGSNNEPQQTQPVQSDVLVRSGYNEIDGSYYNSYTQLTITPPGDWYIYRDSDLAASYLGGEVTGDELSVWGTAEFAQQTVIPDIAFMDMANNNSLSVVYVNLDKLEGDAAADEKACHALVISHLSKEGKVLNQTDDEIVTLGDEEFYLFSFKGADSNCYMAMRKQENYMIVITATDRTAAGKEMFLGFIG